MCSWLLPEIHQLAHTNEDSEKPGQGPWTVALKDDNGSFQKHLSPNSVFPDVYPLYMVYPGIGHNRPPFIFLIFLSHIFRHLLHVRYWVGLWKHKHTWYSPSLNVQWRNYTHTHHPHFWMYECWLLFLIFIFHNDKVSFLYK